MAPYPATKKKSARKGAETQRIRRVFQRPSNKQFDLLKVFLCEISAPLRLCVKLFLRSQLRGHDLKMTPCALSHVPI
jgi:hypothetical protein